MSISIPSRLKAAVIQKTNNVRVRTDKEQSDKLSYGKLWVKTKWNFFETECRHVVAERMTHTQSLHLAKTQTTASTQKLNKSLDMKTLQQIRCFF